MKYKRKKGRQWPLILLYLLYRKSHVLSPHTSWTALTMFTTQYFQRRYNYSGLYLAFRAWLTVNYLFISSEARNAPVVIDVFLHFV